MNLLESVQSGCSQEDSDLVPALKDSRILLPKQTRVSKQPGGVRFAPTAHYRTCSGTESFAQVHQGDEIPETMAPRIPELLVADATSSEDVGVLSRHYVAPPEAVAHQSSLLDDVEARNSRSNNREDDGGYSSSESDSELPTISRASLDALKAQQLEKLQQMKSSRSADIAGGLRARRMHMLKALAEKKKTQTREDKLPRTDPTSVCVHKEKARKEIPVVLHSGEVIEEKVGNECDRGEAFDDYSSRLGGSVKARTSRIASVRGLLNNGSLCALQFVYALGSTLVEGKLVGNCSSADSICAFDLNPLERIVRLTIGCGETGHISYVDFDTTFERSLSFGERCTQLRKIQFQPSGSVQSTGFTLQNGVYHGGLVSIAGAHSRENGIHFIRPVFAEWSPATLLLLHMQHERVRLGHSMNFEKFALDTVRVRSEIGFDMTLVKRWIPDDTRSDCQRCHTSFNKWMAWKHHCRCCGEIFCHSCSSQMQPICEFLPCIAQNRDVPQRLCDGCVKQNKSAFRVASRLNLENKIEV